MNKKLSSKSSRPLGKTASPPVKGAFGEVVDLIQPAKQRAYQAVNGELILLYWQIGEYVSRQMALDGWGRATLENLSSHVQKVHPGVRNFSAANISKMGEFYEAYRARPNLASLLSDLPWTHHLLILDASKRDDEREFYLRLAILEKWPSRELERQIKRGLFKRAAVNPPKAAPRMKGTGAVAQNLFSDGYSQEFLGVAPTGA